MAILSKLHDWSNMMARVNLKYINKSILASGCLANWRTNKESKPSISIRSIRCHCVRSPRSSIQVTVPLEMLWNSIYILIKPSYRLIPTKIRYSRLKRPTSNRARLLKSIPIFLRPLNMLEIQNGPSRHFQLNKLMNELVPLKEYKIY